MTRKELLDVMELKRIELGIGWMELATKIGKPAVWTVSAFKGQQPLDKETTEKLASLLGMEAKELLPLTAAPYRGTLAGGPPSDPTIYRFYEAISVYGEAIKELIAEQFGDGIMSAINFSVDVDKKPDPAGDRVLVTFSGKFLPYEWKA
jgi:cyanate lyase